MATGTMQKVTNDSGTGYCKMVDGTLMCWGNSTIPANNDRIDVTFPVTFSDDPRYQITPVENGYTGTVSLYSWQRLKNKMYVINRGASQSKAILFDWFAVGRWK